MQRKGLTIPELVVVVVVGTALVLVVIALLPRKVHTDPRYRYCRVNLDVIRKSMLVFAFDNNDQFPNQGSTQTEILVNFALELGLKGKLFVCPATEDDEPLDVRETNPNLNHHGSYSYQARHTDNGAGVNGDTDKAVVFLADKAPAGVTYDWSAGDQADDAEDLGAAAMAAMSRNHDGGKFMVVAAKGRTGLERRADVGFERDNIFTLGADGPDQAGSAPALTTQITDRRDSCLLPIPPAAAP